MIKELCLSLASLSLHLILLQGVFRVRPVRLSLVFETLPNLDLLTACLSVGSISQLK